METQGLDIIEMDKTDVCFKREDKVEIQSFWTRKSFQNTTKFCKDFGGDIAVARDEKTFNAMLATYNKTCPHTGWLQFYSGHQKVHGVWRDVTDSTSLRDAFKIEKNEWKFPFSTLTYPLKWKFPFILLFF